MKTKIYVVTTQCAALLAVPYLIIVSGYPAVVTSKNVFSWLFDIGMSSLPQAETLALSWLYRVTRSETLVTVLMLALALAFGVAAGKLLARTPFRIAAAALVAADLILRLFIGAPFGVPAAVIGFAVRACCLALLICVIFFDEKSKQNKEETL